MATDAGIAYPLPMDPGIVSSLLDFGSIGAFALFLILQNRNLQKKQDALFVDFREELQRIDSGFDARADEIRSKYEDVIQTMRREKSQEREKMQDQIQNLQAELLNRERQSLFNMKLDRER